MKNKLVYILLITIILASALPSTAYAAAPSNDDFANAIEFVDATGQTYSIPYNHNADIVINVADATSQPGVDPDNIACGSDTLTAGLRTVWYKYIPTENTSLLVDTFGTPPVYSTGYDTYIAIWTYSSGQFNLVACNDNSGGNTTSLVGFSAFQGTTYYIEVAQFNGLSGSSLSSQSDVGAQADFDLVLRVEYYDPIFEDVQASYPYYDYIQALYNAGLTAGCSTNPLKFCPNSYMSRAQIAVFTLRGENGGTYAPPSTTPLLFKDDWKITPWGQIWANDLYAKGLTAGCKTSPKLLYCPEDISTRAQTAVFGMRLKYGNSYAPPSPTGTVFADLTNVNSWQTLWAEAAYADGLIPDCGIDSGSGKPKFCPDALVDRGFGAFVIAKAKNLVP